MKLTNCLPEPSVVLVNHLLCLKKDPLIVLICVYVVAIIAAPKSLLKHIRVLHGIIFLNIGTILAKVAILSFQYVMTTCKGWMILM